MKIFYILFKKKTYSWEEYESDDNIDVITLALGKNCSNLRIFKPKNKASKISKDDQEKKLMALLTQLIPVLLSARATKENNERSSKSVNGRSRCVNNRNESISSIHNDHR